MNYYDQFYTTNYYFEQNEKFKNGEISYEDWSRYCTIFLNKLMTTNNNILDEIYQKGYDEGFNDGLEQFNNLY